MHWTVDESFIYPPDGKEPIFYWWGFMRPKEMVDLIKEVYQRGFDAGVESTKENKDAGQESVSG